LGTASGNLFPLAVILTQPPVEIGGWCNRTASENLVSTGGCVTPTASGNILFPLAVVKITASGNRFPLAVFQANRQ
jgi:hypothetical protein